MHAFAALITAVDPTPMPSMTVDPELVTPGPIGFAAIAFIALAVVLLIWDMLRRVRRNRYRAEIAAELDAEQAAAAEAETGDAAAAESGTTAPDDAEPAAEAQPEASAPDDDAPAR